MREGGVETSFRGENITCLALGPGSAFYFSERKLKAFFKFCKWKNECFATFQHIHIYMDSLESIPWSYFQNFLAPSMSTFKKNNILSNFALQSSNFINWLTLCQTSTKHHDYKEIPMYKYNKYILRVTALFRFSYKISDFFELIKHNYWDFQHNLGEAGHIQGVWCHYTTDSGWCEAESRETAAGLTLFIQSYVIKPCGG